MTDLYDSEAELVDQLCDNLDKRDIDYYTEYNVLIDDPYANNGNVYGPRADLYIPSVNLVIECKHILHFSSLCRAVGQCSMYEHMSDEAHSAMIIASSLPAHSKKEVKEFIDSTGYCTAVVDTFGSLNVIANNIFETTLLSMNEFEMAKDISVLDTATTHKAVF